MNWKLYIDKYLAGESLDMEIIQQIETKLKEDPDFAKKIAEGIDDHELEGFFQKGIENHGELNLSKQLSALDKELETEGFFETKEAKIKTLKPESTTKVKQENTSKIFGLNRMLAIAASMALIIGLWFALNLNSNQPQNYMTAYFEADKDFVSEEIEDNISGSGFADGAYIEDLKVFQKGMIAYNKKDYPSAKSNLSSFVNARPDELKAKYYLAITLLAQKEYTAGIKHLEPLSLKKGFQFQDESKWYMAITQLELGKKADAIQLLETISTNSSFHTKAKTLLNKIK